MKSSLLHYVFPVEPDVEPLVENPFQDDGCDVVGPMDEKVTGYLFNGRRGAISGDRVPADPTYWCSPNKVTFDKSDEIVEILRSEVLNHHPWFNHYAPFIKTLIEESFERQAFEANDVVSSPYDDSAFFFVIEGSIELLSPEGLNARRASPRAAAFLSKHSRLRFRKGEDFGLERLLHIPVGSRFNYTAVALVPSIVVALRRSLFQKVMMVNYLEPHDFLVNTVNYVRVFDSFSNVERSRIAEAVEAMEFNEGDVLLGEGATADRLCIIQEGCVEVRKRLPSGRHAQVKLLVPSECVGEAEVFSWDAKSVYDYTAYTPTVKALILPQDFLYEFHGNPLLKHLFHRINLSDIENRQRLVKEIIVKDSYCVVESSDHDSEDEEKPLELLNNKDSDEDEDVSMKSPEATQFLLNTFFASNGYRDSDVVQRGITLTAFSSPLSIPQRTVIFRSEPPTLEGESEKVVRARRLRRRAEKPLFDEPQHLYVVLSGTVDLQDDNGARIASITTGGSFGEQRLLKKVKSVCEVTAVVTSHKGCEVMRLDRSLFRENLMKPFAHDYEEFKQLFSFLPFSNAFPESYLLIMHQLSNRIELGPTSIVLAEAVDPQNVYIVCSGKVEIRSSQREEDLFLAEIGDIIGGLEVLDGIKSRASFTAHETSVAIRIPSNQFMSIFRPGLSFVDHLRTTSRFSPYRITSSS